MRIVVDTTPAWTGLVGTIGYTLYDGTTVLQARTTAGIVELPAGSGIYSAEVADALLAGHWVVWDTDNGSPIYASESFPTNLQGYDSGTVVARSIWNLAARAALLYPKQPILFYREWIKDAYLQFIHESGHVYSRTATITLYNNQREYTLPADYRAGKVNSLYLYQGSTLIHALDYDLEREVNGSIYWEVPGLPTTYYYPDATHIAFAPLPSGTSGHTIQFQYDAEPSAAISLIEELPIPPLYEKALIAYAIAEAAVMEGDDKRALIETKRYADGLRQWQNDIKRRTGGFPLARVPYTAYEEG